MATKTAIQWTHLPGYEGKSWNPIGARDKETRQPGWFCVKVASGCASCYAADMNKHRFGNGLDYVRGNVPKVELYLKDLEEPFKQKKPTCYFTNSMTDLFGLDFGVTTEMLDTIYAIMALSPQHLFLNLTKRSKERRAYLNDPETTQRVRDRAEEMWNGTYPNLKLVSTRAGRAWHRSAVFPLKNIWEGSSVACPKDLHQLDDLLMTPASKRFVSYEPAIEAVDFTPYLGWRWVNVNGQGTPSVEAYASYDDLMLSAGFGPVRPIVAIKGGMAREGLNWLIVGGESGKKARPFDQEWARTSIDQGDEFDVPVFIKQMGSNPMEHNVSLKYVDRKGGDITEWSPGLRVRQFPEIIR